MDALASSARLYESVLSTIADFAWLIDRDGRLLFTNRALLELWGRGLDEILNKTFRDLELEEAVYLALERDHREVLQTGKPVEGETPYTSRAGQAGHYEYTLSPVLSVAGGIDAVAGSARDVTRRKAMDARARSILESITDGFFALDRDWRLTYVNPQAERILDREPGELTGQIFWEAYPGTKGSEFERVYRATMETGKPGAFTAYYPDHDRWYEVHAYPSSDGISVYFRDDTERKKADAAAAAMSETLERQSRLFEQIATSTPDFIYVFDLDARFLYANRRLLEVWGVTYEQAVGKGLSELGYPDWHVAMHHREIAEVKATKKPIRGEVPFTGGSGIAAWRPSSATLGRRRASSRTCST